VCWFESSPGHKFFVYSICSAERNYIYVGLTDNPERRIGQHNAGYEKTTRAYAPFSILLIESFPTRLEARALEKYLKSGVGKEYLKGFKKVHEIGSSLPLGRQVQSWAPKAEVVKLVDTHVSGACGASCAGSSPAFGTLKVIQFFE
jgi:putative endonuclease